VTARGAIHRHPWRTLAGGGALLLLVGLTTAALRIVLWASVPYRGYGASYAIVEIPEGAAAQKALAILVDRGVVQRFPMALTYLRLTGRARGLKAGEYSFSRAMRPGEVFDKLIAGEVFYHRVTVMEGSRSDEIISLFSRSGFGTEQELREAIRNVSLVADLDDEAVDLEGYLFPDTYSLQKGTTPAAIVSLMVSRFREVFEPAWVESARRNGLTVREAVTLASLVERETAHPDEDALVASVFHNRLKKGMRLQCDPTVIYALAMRDAYDGNIRKEDLRIDSRYNTYRYFGLPPGPIGNPGAAALHAAAVTADTDYLYFVSMNNGRHFFSTNLKDHNRAVYQFQVKPFRVRPAARPARSGRGN
jgi:UPF0755 protein